MSVKFDDRALAVAVLAGTVSAALIFIVSTALDFPRVWPGTISAFLMTGCGTYLRSARRRP